MHPVSPPLSLLFSGGEETLCRVDAKYDRIAKGAGGQPLGREAHTADRENEQDTERRGQSMQDNDV